MIEGKFTFIDLFGAPGGLSLGCELAGFRSLACVDIDDDALDTYAHNFPSSVCIPGDIKRIESPDLMKKLGISPGELALIAGGPPCQGFSTIGRVKIASLVRARVWTDVKIPIPRFIDDPRNVLYREFVRIVKDLQPKFVIMENVPGMMSYRDGEIVEQIRQDFASIGYGVDARVLNAVNFGVPQRRKRIFFVGNRLGLPNPFPPPTHFDTSRSKGELLDEYMEVRDGRRAVTVWDAIGDLPELDPNGGSEEMDYDKQPFSAYQEWAREASARVYNHKCRYTNETDIEVFGKMEEGMWWRDLPQELKERYGYRDDIFHDKLKKLKRTEPSWTVVAHLYKDGYMYIHPTQARTITVREAARLQSFPDRFMFRGSRTAQFKQVGNAVPPLLARAVASAVLRVLTQKLP